MKQFKVGDRVKLSDDWGEDYGTVTSVDENLGLLVEYDEPVDSGDGVLSFDQWCEPESCERIDDQ